jgi:4-alpha-glucanotransferase
MDNKHILSRIEIQICDIQGRLFKLSVRRGISSAEFVKVFMKSATAKALDSTYNRMQWAGEEYLLEEVIDEARDRFNKECPQIGSSDTYSLIEFAFNSIANLVIIPIQDYLELTNEEGRMNTPSTPEGNWGYRIENNYNNDELKNKIKDIVIRTNRM